MSSNKAASIEAAWRRALRQITVAPRLRFCSKLARRKRLKTG